MQPSSLLVGLCLAARLYAQLLPEVDLGYEVHRASLYDDVDKTYIFKNVRYAEPPVGDLRFAAPVPPSGRSMEVQTGEGTKICPQGVPAWNIIQSQWLPWYLANNASLFNFTQAEVVAETVIAARGGSPANNTFASEDCLFLDVLVDQDVYESAKDGSNNENTGVPVLIWLHGGGYTLGYKDLSYPGDGLLRSARSRGARVIFVPVNYRLGAFGFSAGPTFQEAGGVSNAGLYDQRLAFEWVAEHIHLFGGDRNQITVIGESAGGGSVVHQLTAFGGQKPPPFQRVIAQSPGYLAVPSLANQDSIFKAFLSYAGVSSLAEARNTSSAALIAANAAQVADSLYAEYTYNPSVDGLFVPNLPGVAFRNGAYSKNITVMVGHNTREGVYFTPPTIETDEQLASYVKTLFPTIGDNTTRDLLTHVYPATYDGSLPYTNGLDRAIAVSTDAFFLSNNHMLATAYPQNFHSYKYLVEPGLHGADVPYTFYNGAHGKNTTPVVEDVAFVLQAYITNFVTTGDPNGKGGALWFPAHGQNASMNALDVTGVTVQTDDTINDRTLWWGKGLYV